MCADLEFIINIHNLNDNKNDELPKYPYRFIAAHGTDF